MFPHHCKQNTPKSHFFTSDNAPGKTHENFGKLAGPNRAISKEFTENDMFQEVILGARKVVFFKVSTLCPCDSWNSDKFEENVIFRAERSEPGAQKGACFQIMVFFEIDREKEAKVKIIYQAGYGWRKKRFFQRWPLIIATQKQPTVIFVTRQNCPS